jgi:nickel/cobalt exporter
MDWLIAVQKWLYGGMAQGMRAAEDATTWPLLVASAFLFGVVHAFMPGHGKSVLVSYHLGRPGRIPEGVLTGSLLSLTHVGMAIVLVLAGVAVISRSVAAGGRAAAFETASAVLIVLIGAYLVWRLLRPPQHVHPQDGKLLAVATGLIPCPLTTFILTYALAKGKLAIGLAAVAGMLAGVMLTIISFAVAAIVARQRFVALLARMEKVRGHVGRDFEVASAVAVLGLGVAMLVTRFG